MCRLSFFNYTTSEKCNYTSLDKESSPASRSALQSSVPGNNPFEGVKADEDEEEGFVKLELPYEVAEDGREGDSFNMFPSRADEALKTCKHSERMHPNAAQTAVYFMFIFK